MEVLIQNFGFITWQMLAMWAIGGALIYLAIAKQMEPTLLLPMGFGAILVNLPVDPAAVQAAIESGSHLPGVQGVLQTLFEIGIEGAELFPLLLFIGIGAMIDFTPADQPQADDLRRCRPVWHFLHSGAGLFVGL